MAKRFTAPADGLEERPVLEQRDGDEDGVFALCAMAITEIRKATDNLADGSISVATWHELMTDIIVTYHLAGWYIGNEDDPDDDVMDMIAEKIADQLDYLDNFRADLEAVKEDTLAAMYRNRAEMYGWAARIGFWIGQTHGIELPFYPAERSICKIFCACAWVIAAVDGGFDATWRLGETDHCGTCVERAKLKPLRIREGKYDRSQVTKKMYA